MCSTTELTARRRKMRIQYSVAPGLASISMRHFDEACDAVAVNRESECL